MEKALGGFDAATIYSAAAEDYERASEHYWQFLSTRTVMQLPLRAGQQVLDAACGTGPATIAAARRVGPSGRVVGVDYASGMLALARQRVAASGIDGIELVQADMLALPDDWREAFDMVVCVLGIFFVDDMAAAARALWSHVRPGGTLAVTTFGTEVWTPMLEYFDDAARRARPDIERILPWRRTENPAVLAQALRDGGVEDVRIRQEHHEIPFRAEDWPLVVTGSGLRRIAVALDAAAPGVLAECECWAHARHITHVGVSINYATAVKQG